LTFLLSLLCSGTYVFVCRILLGLALDWSWIAELAKALVNCLIAMAVFPMFDRLQIKE
jgi:hypothetical protein